MKILEIIDKQDILKLNSDLSILLEDACMKTLKETAPELCGNFKDTLEPFASLVLIGDQLMAELNSKYRDREGTTDVLAFQLTEKNDTGCYLGEVLISTEQAVVQARENKHSLRREVVFLFIHGLLHLLGFGHYTIADKEKMEKLENKLMNKIL